MQIISEKFLSLGVDDPSEISDNQLVLLDIDVNKKELWYELALGKNISDARAELFVLLKGISTKVNQEKIIKNYKDEPKLDSKKLNTFCYLIYKSCANLIHC